MALLPNFIGINCTVAGNTLTTTSGGFTGGAYSQTGYSNVSVSTTFGTTGSSAMLIGLNTTSNIALSVGDYKWSEYQLYFHADSGYYAAMINGVIVLQTSFAPVSGDVGAMTYNGTSITFSINDTPIYTYPLPATQTFLPLYVTWTSDYLGATSTLTVTPGFFSTASAAPYAALITSEHNQKPNFMNLVELLTAGVGDVSATLNGMPAAFDLNGGAVGAQLDVLGEWIGQSRVIPNVLATGYFGFSTLPLPGTPLGLQLGFGNLAHASQGGVWFGLQDSASSTTTLNDAQYITILNARIARNQSDGNLDDLETALLDIFGVPAKVMDNGTLSLAITISAPVSPVDQALVTGLDILPRPAGVRIASITYVP